MRLLTAFAVLLAWASAATATDREQTLADIRQELSVLYVEIQTLRRELSTTGSPTAVQLQGTSALNRIDAMESALTRLTAQTEQLENRVNRIVSDGTNRIGDLEFRLVELEGGDITQLGQTTTLGGENLGDTQTAAISPSSPDGTGGAQLAVGEQSDFDRAREAFEAGSYETAVIQFATFTETYTGGPLTSEAHYWRAKALAALGDTSGAARAFLESFSGDPSSPIAPQSLLELGLTLDALGQADEACVMLIEVTQRFPTSQASIEAQTARADLGCV
ncbi:MAG: tol-pal system protein YbgF [Pseudomonadota bacterium]